LIPGNLPCLRACLSALAAGFLVRQQTSVAAIILCICFSSGCASGPDKSAPPNPADPWAKTNRAIYNFNSDLDRAVVKDVSDAYTKHVSQSGRSAIGNFFDNLAYLNVILNDHLQGRFAQGWRDTGRMAINTTVGFFGLADPATEWGLPRQKNDFGITLGKWGCSSGPYVTLPLLGPSTVRDVPGLVVSRVTNPMFWLDAPLEVSIPMDVTSYIDQRAALQPQMDLRDRAAIDPYTFTRDVYLRRRSAAIGEKPVTEDEDIYAESAPTTAPSVPTTMPATGR
jgi:phospholipid-binding lipoprotein MlaA